MKLVSENRGIMGTGSNMFVSAYECKDKNVYIGTYGPQPAILWKYVPGSGKLEEIARPGEYQLCGMVEGPNNKLYIGTAYGAIVYEYDPATGVVKSLGTPPIDSTPWIFSLICTSKGEVYGAKGIGIFKLDWRTGTFSVVGTVPGVHRTHGTNVAMPIIGAMEERPDGKIWVTTQRWVFEFDTETDTITPIVDICESEYGCYMIQHANGPSPVNDMYYHVFTRYSGFEIKSPLNCLDAETHQIRNLKGVPFDGKESFCGSTTIDGEHVLLLSYTVKGGCELIAYNPRTESVVRKWYDDSGEQRLSRVRGNHDSMLFKSAARGTLFEARMDDDKLRTLVVNPVPVECRSLAMSPANRLGTDTYDCGYVFTADEETMEFTPHGRVWEDDHRCNFGPAVFTEDSRYFFANHSEGMSSLWMTDTIENTSRSIGESAIDLISVQCGLIAGKHGPCPPHYRYDKTMHWMDDWREKEGELFFFSPSDSETRKTGLQITGLSPAPDIAGHIAISIGNTLSLYNVEKLEQVSSVIMDDKIVRIAPAKGGGFCVVTAGGELYRCAYENNTLKPTHLCSGFTERSRGFFVLPISGNAVALSDQYATVYGAEGYRQIELSQPFPQTGPAVSRTRDSFYFADMSVTRYCFV